MVRCCTGWSGGHRNCRGFSVPERFPFRAGGWSARLACALVLVAIAALQLGQGNAPVDKPTAPDLAGVNVRTPAVLILASYERSQTTTRAQEDAVRTEIEKAFPFARIRSDYFVSGRSTPEEPSDELLQSLANTMLVQYRGTKFDVIVALDTVAFRVLAGPGRELVKDTPLVFSGLTLDPAAAEATGLNATGVYERIDAAGTARLVLALQPDCKHLFVVATGSKRAENVRAIAAAQLQHFRSEAEVVWAKATTTADLINEVRAQGPHTAVIYVAFTDTRSGDWGARGLRIDWPAPTYGLYGSNISLGMVGGSVVDSTTQGRLAGAMAVRILNGESPKAIEPCVGCCNRAIVREPMLKRWGIPTARVPSGTEILEPLPGWLESHREIVLWIGLACVLQGAVIALLLINRAARRRAETELQTHLGLLELVTNTVPVFMSYIDADGRYRWVNHRYEEWFGRPQDQIVGKRVNELHPPEAYQVMRPHLERALAGERVEYSVRNIGADGREAALEAVYLPRVDARGARLGFFALVTDATARQNAEAALRAAEERYALAIQGSTDGIWDWDKVTDRVYWSPRMAELVGREAGTVSRHDPSRANLVHPDDRQRNQDAIAAHIERGEPYDVEIRVDVKGKGYRWFRARGVAHRDASGQAVRMAGSMSDVHERVLATERLRESEERYRQAFHTNQAIKLVLDPADGRIVDANEAASAFYGYSLDALLKMSIYDINTLPRHELGRRIEEGAKEQVRFEFQHRLASGEIRDVEVYTGPFQYHGRPMLFSIVHDITAVQRSRRALAESESKYRRIVETAAEGIWMVDVGWTTTFVNARMASMLGCTPEEMVGKHLFDFMDDEARAECERNMQRREEGIEEQHEFRLRHKDGRSVWTTMATGPLTGDSGEFIGALAMVTDITERRVAQAAVYEAEKRFRSTFEHAAVGISNVDLEGRWLMVNDRMCEIVGRTRDNLMTMRFADITHPDDIEENSRLLKNTLSGGGDVYSMDKRYVRPDGSIVWAHVTASLVRDEAGRPQHFISVIQDISDRKRAEAELAASRRVLEQAQAVGRIGSWTFEIGDEASLRWSDEVFRIFGMARSEFNGREEMFYRSVHPDDLPAIVEAHRAAFAGERDYNVDHRIIRADGTIRWVHEHAEIERDASGAPIRMIGVAQDITERKLAEEELFRSMGRFRALVDATSDVVYRMNPDWSEMRHLVGRDFIADTESPTATWLDKYIHPDDQALVLKTIRAAIHSKSVFELEHRVLRADGSLGWTFSREIPILDADGTIIEWFGAASDISLRKQTEVILRESEERLRLAQSAANLGTFEWSITTGRIIWSEEHARIWGIPLDQFEGTYEGFARQVHPDDLPAVNDAIQHSMHTRAPYQREFRVIRPDGTMRWILARGAFEYGPDGRAARMRGVVVDITERKAAEEAREHSEAAYRALLEAIPDMMFRVDRTGVYRDYHAPDPSRLMVPPERFMGRAVRDVLPRERAEQCMAAVEKLFATGEPQVYEYSVRRPDGTDAWWEVRVVRARRDEALLLLRDVSERREAERRQRDSEQRLRLLVQSTPLGVISWNLDFTVSGWNPGAARLFGHSEAEAIGQHASFIVPESARGGVDSVWRELLANRGGFRATNQNVRKNGDLVYCDWYNAPLVDASGRVIGVASLVEDVTERRLAQQRTDFMMAELDHRVKNNLAAVISLAEQTGRGSTDYREFLDTFMGRIRAMARMHSVLARSRWQGAELRPLVTQTLEAFGSGSFGRASVSGPAAMLGPKTAQAIAMALNELATNAVKYGALSAAGGRVEVAWTIEPGPDEARRLKMRWQERGGPPVVPPARRGFGTELIEGAIAYELQGTAKLAFPPEGVECVIDVPLVSELESHIRDEGGI